MDIRKINDTSSGPVQIGPEDAKALARRGFRSIICHWPDSDGADQTSAEQIVAVANVVGLATPVRAHEERPRPCGC